MKYYEPIKIEIIPADASDILTASGFDLPDLPFGEREIDG